MRQLQCISAVLAVVGVLCSPMSAAMMQAANPMGCAHMVMQCDRHAKGHALKSHAAHCGAMHEQEFAAPGIVISSRRKDCPMGCCCCARSLPNTPAVASFTLAPPLAVQETEPQYVPVTFTSAGFSSHTDRGPPAA